MFSDLITDAAPLGTTPLGSNTDRPTSSPAPSTNDTIRAPGMVTINNSDHVHFGPTIYMSPPSPVVAPHHLAGGGPTDPRPQRDHVLSMLQVTREVSDREMVLVSEHLGDVWRSLGRNMGYSKGNLDNIDNDLRRLQDKTYELLSLWHDRESAEASLANLIRLLMYVEAFDVVNRLYTTLGLS